MRDSLDTGWMGALQCAKAHRAERDASLSRGPPWGLFGGLHGDPGYCEYENGKCERETIHKVANLSMEAGDRLHVHTGAGGGYGPPAERDPEKVRVDVLRGYVSKQQAEAIYGVEIGQDGKVDAGATARRRAATG